LGFFIGATHSIDCPTIYAIFYSFFLVTKRTKKFLRAATPRHYEDINSFKVSVASERFILARLLSLAFGELQEGMPTFLIIFKL